MTILFSVGYIAICILAFGLILGCDHGDIWPPFLLIAAIIWPLTIATVILLSVIITVLRIGYRVGMQLSEKWPRDSRG